MTEQHTDEVPKRKTRAGKRPALRDVKFERQYTGWLLERLEAARGDCIHALYLVGVTAATVTPLSVRQEASAAASTMKPVKTTGKKSAASESARPSVVVNGEDLSDYID